MKGLYRLLLSAGLLSIAALVISSNPVTAASLTVDVAPDLATFNSTREPAEGAMMPTGPFYIQGQIFDEGTLNPDGSIPDGANSIGTFHCWGWIYDGGEGKGVISQIFAIDGQGEIHVQGLEVFDLSRAVTGGTDEFMSATGVANYSYHNLPDSLSFQIAFEP